MWRCSSKNEIQRSRGKRPIRCSPFVSSRRASKAAASATEFFSPFRFAASRKNKRAKRGFKTPRGIGVTDQKKKLKEISSSRTRAKLKRTAPGSNTNNGSRRFAFSVLIAPSSSKEDKGGAATLTNVQVHSSDPINISNMSTVRNNTVDTAERLLRRALVIASFRC